MRPDAAETSDPEREETMPKRLASDTECHSLLDRYTRLRKAAQAVVDAAGYDEDGRVYRAQLRDLERELRGEPQPNGLKWMSVS